MAIETLDDIKNMLNSFINREWPVKPAPDLLAGKKINWDSYTENLRATLIAKVLIATSQNLPISTKPGEDTYSRCNLLADLTAFFVQLSRSNNQEQNEQLAQLKLAIKNLDNQNWKNSILGITHLDIIKGKQIKKTFNNEASNTVSNHPDRFTTLETSPNSRTTYSAILGSTFTTQCERYISAVPSLILDSCYMTILNHSDPRHPSIIAAVADGAGHTQEADINNNTARAAYYACKHGARLMSVFTNPDDLLQGLPQVIDAIKKEVIYKAAGSESTLLIVRSFYQDEKHIRVVGFNLGDSLLMQWQPSTQTAHTLSAKHTTIPAGTASLPYGVRDFDIRPIDVTLEQDSFIMLMTDGMVEGLPTKHEQLTYGKDSTKYQETRLQTEILNSHFNYASTSKKSTPSHLLNLLLNYTTHAIDKQREEKINSQISDFKLGDDICIVGAQLHIDKPPFSDRFKAKFRGLFERKDTTKTPSSEQQKTNTDGINVQAPQL